MLNIWNPSFYISIFNWTIKKLVGGNVYANILNFAEIQIFGKELNYFQSDWNSTILNKPDLTQYATNSNLNNFSSSSMRSC